MAERDIEIKLKKLNSGCVSETEGGISVKDSEVMLDAPKDKTHGDLATNIALRASKEAGKKPMEYASLLADTINKKLPNSSLSKEIEKAEAKNPGFNNPFYSISKSLNLLISYLLFFTFHFSFFISLNGSLLIAPCSFES